MNEHAAGIRLLAWLVLLIVLLIVAARLIPVDVVSVPGGICHPELGFCIAT